MHKLVKTLTTTVIIATLLFAVTTTFAWQNPKLKTLCAPNALVRAFEITLAVEEDQNIEFSFDNFDTILKTTDFITDGTHYFTTGSGNTTLYARYQSDHGASDSISIDETLCNQEEHESPPEEPEPPRDNPNNRSSDRKSSKTYGYILKTPVTPPTTTPVHTPTPAERYGK